MSSFIIDFNPEQSILNVKFGDPATNAEIVKDAASRLAEIKEDGGLQGGPLLRVNGPASLPCAFTIAHAVMHAYGAVAVWDPKLQKYVVAVVHNPEYQLGQLTD